MLKYLNFIFKSCPLCIHLTRLMVVLLSSYKLLYESEADQIPPVESRKGGEEHLVLLWTPLEGR